MLIDMLHYQGGIGYFMGHNFCAQLSMPEKKAPPIVMIQHLQNVDLLIDGFNPSEHYESQLE